MPNETWDIQGILAPGETVLTGCGALYATSRRLIWYDGNGDGGRIEEVPYHQIAAVELVRKPSHPFMILGTIAILAAIFLTITGFIFITAFLALAGGAALLIYGSKGNVAYYQLHINRTPSPVPDLNRSEWEVTLQRLKGALGLKPSKEKEDERWRLDYLEGKSFIATVRNIKGSLPEL